MSQWLAAAGLYCVALTANAALVTLVGDTINYEYEDSQAAMTLFGQPVIVGDAVRFLPFTYRAQSLDGAGAASADAEFIFSSVYSQDGTSLGGISVFEFGDYEISNGGSVSGEILLTVEDNISGESAMAGQSFSDNVNLGSLQLWSLTTGLDAETVFSALTDNISLAIHNTLTATSDALGDVSWIQTKMAFAAVSKGSGTVNPPTEVVPVPGVVWLFGAGLLALGSTRRKKAVGMKIMGGKNA